MLTAGIFLMNGIKIINDKKDDRFDISISERSSFWCR